MHVRIPYVMAAAFTLFATSIVCGTDYETFAEPVRRIDASIGEAGRVETVDVKRGDVVEPGDVILSLDTAILEASRRTAQSKAGATADLKRLTIEHRLTHDRLEKLRELEASGAGSREEVVRAEADVAVAALEVERVKENLELLAMQVAEIEAQIERRRVRSPIRGVIVDIARESGEYVSAHDPVVATIVQLDQLRATFYVPANAAESLETKSSEDHISHRRVTLSFPETRQRVDGTVEYLGVVTEADSGLVRVDLLIDNSTGAFRSGARVRLTSDALVSARMSALPPPPVDAAATESHPDTP